MKKNIRPYRSGDKESVKSLISTIIDEEYPSHKGVYPDSDLERIGVIYGGSRDTFFVAEESGEVVGTVGVKEDSPYDALLRRFFVKRSSRGQGLGKGLIEEAISYAKEKGYKRMVFRATDKMVDAMRLCLKYCFKETDRLPVGAFHLHILELKIR